MDAFYAAVEERLNPELRGRPIVVGADPKAGAGRGVVTTASYAARKYGIRSAMPITRAWRLAEAARRRGEPEAVFLRGDRAVYREVSDRIMAIAARGADAFEEASIDEAFLDLSSLGDFERAAVHARAVKAEVVEREGLTCSIGIGPNKLVAKIASDFQKPDGLTVVRPEAVQAFLDPLPIRRIPGIGPKSEASLHERGIRTIAELRAVERTQLAEWFGKRGDEMAERARGISGSPVSQRVGAQVGGRAGDVRARHARAGPRPGARPGARRGRVQASAGRRLRRLPDGHRHRPVRKLRDPDPLPDGGDPDRHPGRARGARA